MAKRFCFMALLLLLLVSTLVITQGQASADHEPLVDAAEVSEARGLLTTLDCSSRCAYRCSKSWKVKMCNKMCMVCCSKCGCVPDGPRASKATCRCYDSLRNNKGKSKCP